MIIRFRERFLQALDGMKSINYVFTDKQLALEFGTRLNDWAKIKHKNPSTIEEVLELAINLESPVKQFNDSFMTYVKPSNFNNRRVNVKCSVCGRMNHDKKNCRLAQTAFCQMSN